MSDTATVERPTFEVRTAPEWQVRKAEDGSHFETLEVTFARFDVWTEIYDWWEGRFLELVEFGAYTDTFAERGPDGSGMIRCLFQHGYDPFVGKKPLGAVEQLREDPTGPTGVVRLLRAQYAQDVAEGVDAGIYGASYAFGIRNAGTEVVGETWNRDPGRSAHNPDGIPERRIHAVNVGEFCPVTFPADEGTNDPGMQSVRALDPATLEQFRHDKAPAQGAAPGVVRTPGLVNTANLDTAAQARAAVAFGMAQRRRRATHPQTANPNTGAQIR